MTYTEFLSALSSTPRTWKLETVEYPSGATYPDIIRNAEGKCPIQAIFSLVMCSKLDLDRETIPIIAAADNDPKHRASIRKDLLRACSISDCD